MYAYVSDLLQGPLDVDALSPGGGGVGETLSGVPAARDVDTLPPQVLEGGGHDGDAVVGQSPGVLREEGTLISILI